MKNADDQDVRRTSSIIDHVAAVWMVSIAPARAFVQEGRAQIRKLRQGVQHLMQSGNIAVRLMKTEKR